MELRSLTDRQRQTLARWAPRAALVRDHSWGLVQTTVLELEDPQHGRVILKAGGPEDHHLAREVRAHREWLRPWARTGHAPQLIAADETGKLLMTRFLPGELVEGHTAQDDPDTYRQAGVLLARFHAQLSRSSSDWGLRLVQRALGWLGRPHRIDAASVAALRAEISTWPVHGEVTLVPTHGDWQPRNWLIDEGAVRVIDFGRADLRPALEDLARLARQDFARDPALEDAFLSGYCADPREAGLWRRTLVVEAISTAAWAHGVGDEDFEQVGLQQISRLLG